MTSPEKDRIEVHRELRDELIRFVTAYPEPHLEKFEHNLVNWGEQWRDTGRAYLPGADNLQATLDSATPTTRPLLALYTGWRRDLFWEQSYRSEDGLVGEDMLSNYGFTEIIGKNGPFVSELTRSGIGVWGPDIVYPRHFHKAEEIYLVMGGSGWFRVGDRPEELKRAGELVFVPSNTPHGFRTAGEAMSILYIWQSGDMREISTFG